MATRSGINQHYLDSLERGMMLIGEAFQNALPVIQEVQKLWVARLRMPRGRYGRAIHRAIRRHRARLDFYWIKE